MFNADHMYTYIRGFATGAMMPETLKALVFAREKHNGQTRKNGDPYIIHPLTMACEAMSLGIRDDEVVATILLHDVCEDCDVGLSELPVDDKTRHSVELMTFKIMPGETKEVAQNRYYNMILQDRAATLTKLMDRCHNVSSMAGVFSIDKLKAYIEETQLYVLPLLRKAKQAYPEDSDILFILKYHIISVIDSIDATMKVFENAEVSDPSRKTMGSLQPSNREEMSA